MGLIAGVGDFGIDELKNIAVSSKNVAVSKAAEALTSSELASQKATAAVTAAEMAQSIAESVGDKLQVITSIPDLKAYTAFDFAYFDGSMWERKTGDITSNGGTNSGTLIRVSSTKYWQRKLQNNIVTAEMFGGIPDNMTDNFFAINRAIEVLNSIGGGILSLSTGTYLINTSASSSTVGSNISVIGANNSITIIKSTGANFIFSVSNASNIEFRNIKFVGNTNGQSLAISIEQTSEATSTNSDYNIDNCIFENFKSQYWILATNYSTTYNLSKFRVNGCYFFSKTGNVVDGTNIGVPSSCLFFQGTTTGSTISDISVTNNFADCYYIKNFVTIFRNAFDYTIRNNKIYNSGVDSSISDNTAAYAITIYDVNTSSPINTIADNKIIGVKSCGIYVADGVNISIKNNNISGQTDQVNSVIPKGGISINLGSDVHCEGNTINNCYIGITVIGGNVLSTRNYFTDNIINNSTHSSLYAKIFGTGSNAELFINGLKISNSVNGARGIFIESNTTSSFKTVEILNFSIKSHQSAIESYTASGAPIYKNFIIDNGTISGCAVQGIRVVNFTDENTRVNIKNVRFIGNYVGTGYTLLAISNSRNLNISNIIFQNTGYSGLCIDSELSQGTINNITYQNCENNTLYYNSLNVDLGVDKPNWTGYGANYVQNLKQTEAGSIGSKYIVTGWSWDKIASVWLDNRFLTGN